MPLQPGGHFGQAGWSGETDVCRAASGAAIKGAWQRWRQASAMVVARWLAGGPFISQGWRGGRGRHGHTTQGDQPSWGAWDSRLLLLEPGESPAVGHCPEFRKGHSARPLWSRQLPSCPVTSESDHPARLAGSFCPPLPPHTPASGGRGHLPFVPCACRRGGAQTAEQCSSPAPHPAPPQEAPGMSYPLLPPCLCPGLSLCLGQPFPHCHILTLKDSAERHSSREIILCPEVPLFALQPQSPITCVTPQCSFQLAHLFPHQPMSSPREERLTQ